MTTATQLTAAITRHGDNLSSFRSVLRWDLVEVASHLRHSGADLIALLGAPMRSTVSESLIAEGQSLVDMSSVALTDAGV